MASRHRRNAGHDRSGLRGSAHRLVERPGDDSNVGVARVLRVAVALAGVDPAIGGEGGIDGQPHEAGLALGEQIAEVGGDRGRGGPVGDGHETPGSLGCDDRAVGKGIDVPRMVESGDGGDGEAGGGSEAGSPLRGVEEGGGQRAKRGAAFDEIRPVREASWFGGALQHAQVDQRGRDLTLEEGAVFGRFGDDGDELAQRQTPGLDLGAPVVEAALVGSTTERSPIDRGNDLIGRLGVAERLELRALEHRLGGTGEREPGGGPRHPESQTCDVGGSIQDRVIEPNDRRRRLLELGRGQQELDERRRLDPATKLIRPVLEPRLIGPTRQEVSVHLVDELLLGGESLGEERRGTGRRGRSGERGDEGEAEDGGERTESNHRRNLVDVGSSAAAPRRR